VLSCIPASARGAATSRCEQRIVVTTRGVRAASRESSHYPATNDAGILEIAKLKSGNCGKIARGGVRDSSAAFRYPRRNDF